ncbi:adenosine deaminase [Salinisphaera sp. SPP-AMP-43]|uniref:adenosine deaminase n=1 Tax=Salinisphaera sp. SPP-AMP-43 TaxID=3121288 RepID=UPI003C6E4026
MQDWLKGLPKAELHLHIEGTLEPEQQFELARRNGITLPYESAAALRTAYDFADLASFLALYYQGMNVLQQERDFYELAMAYFERAVADNVLHADISFDPQAHLVRGIDLAVPFEALGQAMADAESQWGISSALIMSFMRDREAEEAMDVLRRAEPWYDRIAAVGLDSAEVGNPPEKFAAVFDAAKERRIPRVAHAGEEGPASYIRGALDTLDVCRIDHGVRCIDDAELVERLRREQIPLTVCPLSNVYLKGVARLEDHSLPAMLEAGLNVNLNSDDPAYFGGGMANNFIACHAAFDWDTTIFKQLAGNGINAAFASDNRRAQMHAELEAY